MIYMKSKTSGEIHKVLKSMMHKYLKIGWSFPEREEMLSKGIKRV